MPRYAAKVDNNQGAIVQGLRDVFGPDCVQDLSAVGRGCPDIAVGVRGRTLFLEIKGAKGSLTPDQIIWHSTWPGQVDVVTTLQEALAVIERETV